MAHVAVVGELGDLDRARAVRAAPRSPGGPRRAAGTGRTGTRWSLSVRSSRCSDSRRAWVKPVPTPPANRSRPSGCGMPTSSAPNVFERLPVPGLKPPITTSDRDPVLHLAPVRRALARQVRRAESLGHHAFQALFGGGREQCRHRRRPGAPAPASCCPASTSCSSSARRCSYGSAIVSAPSICSTSKT